MLLRLLAWTSCRSSRLAAGFLRICIWFARAMPAMLLLWSTRKAWFEYWFASSGSRAPHPSWEGISPELSYINVLILIQKWPSQATPTSVCPLGLERNWAAFLRCATSSIGGDSDALPAAKPQCCFFKVLNVIICSKSCNRVMKIGNLYRVTALRIFTQTSSDRSALSD